MQTSVMTQAQASLIKRRTHWKFEPINQEQYAKIERLSSELILSKEDASDLIQALFDLEQNRRGYQYPELYELESKFIKSAEQTIISILSKY